MDNNDFFRNRRTIRVYEKRRVSDELLREIALEASHAPTTGNMQLYSMVATRDAELKAQLAPCHFNQPSVEGCDVLLTFCADYHRFVRWCELNDAAPGYDNFQSFMTAVLDTVIFAQQFCTAAEMRGLGCCYLGTTTYNAPQIAEILELPELVVPVTTLTLGFPAAEGVDCGRLPVEAVIHTDKYSDYSDADIRRLYAPKEAREDSKRFVAENGKSTLAQVFTDVRYTRQANEHFSKVYFDFIKSRGYGMPVNTDKPKQQNKIVAKSNQR
jgi:nitroreductase